METLIAPEDSTVIDEELRRISQQFDEAEAAMREAQWESSAADPTYETAVEDEEIISRESYAHSLHLLRQLGRHALEGTLDTHAGREVMYAARQDWEASLVEMLQTDKDFRRELEITRERTFAIKDGQVRSNQGEPMVDMLRRGAEKSARDAEHDPRMRTQANRDAADVRNAEAVDAMPVGTLRMTIAMDPKEAMQRDGKQFWEDFGYREGLAFVQWYYKVDEHTVIASAYSVDYSELNKWRALWSEFGGDIPEGESTDTWLDYGIDLRCRDIDEARAKARAVRDRYYQKYNLTPPTKTADEFKAANSEVFDEAFWYMYVPLAEVHASEMKNEEVHEIVEGLLQDDSPFKDEIIQQLYRIYTGETLDDELSRLMEYIIRYGVVEHLRTGLKAYRGGNQQTVRLFTKGGGTVTLAPWQMVARSIAGGVIDGTRAGHTYGGCTPSMKLSDKSNAEGDPQEAYGGKGKEDKDDGLGERHIGVCRTPGCPSRPGMTEVGGCDVCLKHCQPLWNAGVNPEDIFGVSKHRKEKSREVRYEGSFLSGAREKAKAENKMRVTHKGGGRIAFLG